VDRECQARAKVATALLSRNSEARRSNLCVSGESLDQADCSSRTRHALRSGAEVLFNNAQLCVTTARAPMRSRRMAKHGVVELLARRITGNGRAAASRSRGRRQHRQRVACYAVTGSKGMGFRRDQGGMLAMRVLSIGSGPGRAREAIGQGSTPRLHSVVQMQLERGVEVLKTQRARIRR